MSQKELITALRSLAKGSANRTNTARLRGVFGEVEGAIKAGVSVAKVHETLVAKGFTMKFSAFQNALYRIRKEREAAKASEPGTT